MTACIDSPNRAQQSRSAARIRRRLCPAPHITTCSASPNAPLSGLRAGPAASSMAPRISAIRALQPGPRAACLSFAVRVHEASLFSGLCGSAALAGGAQGCGPYEGGQDHQAPLRERGDADRIACRLGLHGGLLMRLGWAVAGQHGGSLLVSLALGQYRRGNPRGFAAVEQCQVLQVTAPSCAGKKGPDSNYPNKSTTDIPRKLPSTI